MAATLSTPNVQVAEQAFGSLHGRIVRVTWATNGYATNGADLSTYIRGSLIGAVIIGNTGAGALVQIPQFDYATKKLTLLFTDGTTIVEVTNGTSTAQVVDVLLLTS